MTDEMEQTPNPEADLFLTLQTAGLSEKRAALSVAATQALGGKYSEEILALSAYAMKLSRELAAAQEDCARLVIAFIQGAKWWEYEKENATMWPSDQGLAEVEALARIAKSTLGVNTFQQRVNELDTARKEQADGE